MCRGVAASAARQKAQRQDGCRRLESQEVAWVVDHRGVAIPGHHMALAFQHLPGLGIVAAYDDENTAGKADLTWFTQAVEHIQHAAAVKDSASSRVENNVGTSVMRAIGACRGAASGAKPVALATTVNSHRSGTARCGRAEAALARPATTSAAGRSSRSAHCAKSGADTMRPSEVSVPAAASKMKSYSLDLPAAMISKPRSSAQVISSISRLADRHQQG